MTLNISDVTPDFEVDATEGRIRFHEWLGDSRGVLFSGRKDFTPIATMELGFVTGFKPAFEQRNVEIISL